jgi:hypothetical protein
MNLGSIGQLIRLRYKLIWARTRTRNGKIALFLVFYALVIMVGGLLAAGGVTAGIVAVRSGKAELVAQGVLTGLFVWALITSALLGFGINAAFTDTELRKYPLTSRERLAARHLTGMADPFWFVLVALQLGLAFGLYAYGAGSFLLGIAAVALLYICNYVAAQVLATVIERLMNRRGGAFVLPLLIISLSVLPSILVQALPKTASVRGAFVQGLRFTPGFAAGSLMAGPATSAFAGLIGLILWIGGLTLALAALERHPAKIRSVQSGKIKWDDRFLAAGSVFGPRYGALVAHWMLFYSRCRRFRLQYLISLPLLPFLLLMWVNGAHDPDPFVPSLGVFAIAGLAPAAAFIVNQFGYSGGGFRRYFLFPGEPAAALRGSSYALLLLCSVSLAEVSLVWLFFGKGAHNLASFTMLVGAGVFGLFAFHAAGLWTTLYGGRKSDPGHLMGNDMSFAGNLLVIGGTMTFLFGARVAGFVWKGGIGPQYWWVTLAMAAAAAVAYEFSLRAASVHLARRRERVLAIVEGKA